MWVIDVVCSDPECGEEELQIWTDDLDEVEAVACACGHATIALRVAVYEPELPIRLRRSERPVAAGAAG